MEPLTGLEQLTGLLHKAHMLVGIISSTAVWYGVEKCARLVTHLVSCVEDSIYGEEVHVDVHCVPCLAATLLCSSNEVDVSK